MTRSEQFQMSAALVKSASPRAAKIFKQLSKLSQKRWADSIPQGKTRQIGKRQLGEGFEGQVHPSITGGGHGESSVKSFYDHPQQRLKQMSEGEPKGMWGHYPLQKRIDVMRAYPDIFPEVLGQHRRGMVVERLSDIKPPKWWQPWSAMRHNSKMKKLSDKIRSKEFQFPGTEHPDNPLLRRSTYLPMGKENLHVSDFGLKDDKLKNIMQNRRGDYVISDPVPVRDLGG